MVSLGTVIGTIRINSAQAVAAYAAVRAAHASTLYALRGTSTAFLAASRGMAVAGLVLVGVFAKAASAAATFERQMDFFGAVTGSSTDQVERASAAALQLGQDTIYSANEIATSFVELGKAGVGAEDIINGVGRAVANLGAAADIPLDTAANIITSAIQTFGLGAENAVHVADLLAGAANASIASVEDLGVSLKYVGGIAASVHVPIESVIDALSILAKAGIRGSTAGTSLRQIMVSLTGTSKKAQGVLKDLGIITKDNTNLFVDQKGHIKPLAEVFQILQDHTKNLTEAQRLAAFKTIFNNRALAAAAILTQAGAKGFEAMNGEISKTTAAEVASKRLDNLSGDLEILRGNLETIFIKAGGPFQETLRGFVQMFTRWAQAFANLSPHTQKLIFQIIGITGIILVAGAAIAGFIGIVFRIAYVVIRVVQAFMFLWRILRIVMLAWRVFGVTSLLLSGPLGWIVLAIVALVAGFILLYKHSERVRNAVAAAGRWIASAWQATVAWFKTLPGTFSNIWNAVVNWFRQAGQWIVNAWNGTIAWFQALPGRISAFFTQMAQQVWAATVTGWNNVITFFSTLPERMAYWVGFAIGRVIRLWIQFEIWLGTIIRNIVTSVINWFQQLPGRLAALWASIVNGAQAKWNSLKTNTVRLAQSTYTGVVTWFQQLPGRVASFFSSMYSRAVSLASQLASRARSLASSAVSGMISFFQQLPGRVSSFFSSMLSRAASLLASLVSRARSLASQVYSGIAAGIQGIPGLVSDIFNRAVDAISGVIGAAYARAKSIASSLWNGFKDGLGIHSPSFIERAMFAIRDNMIADTDTVARHVSKLQALGRSLPKEQLKVAGALSSTVNGTTSATGSFIPKQRTDGTTTATGTVRNINIEINNPVAEKSGESVNESLQRLTLLGVI